MLNFYSASNGQVNSKKAIQQSLTAALGDAAPHIFQEEMLVVVHSTIGHEFEDIIAGAKEICPQAELVGCTCAGVIGKEGANESMRALGVMAIVPGQTKEYHVTSCDNIRGYNSFEEARKMALELKATGADINMIQFLASGIDIAADRAVEGIESVFGEGIPIFGGTSSDNMRAISSYQFVDGKVLERGAIMIGYSDPTLTIEMGVHHGSVPIGQSFTVTRSEGNRVIEIEDQAAWPYLMSKLDLPPDTHPGPCIPIAGMAELLPEAYRDSYDNDHILRVIVKVDEDGSFYMPVDCPQGTQLWIVERDEDLIFEGLDRMMKRLVAQIGGQKVAAVFHTDCAARGRAMFDAIVKDEIIENMQQPVTKGEAVPWLGMYGFGEFTSLKAKNLFHNYTTSIYALIRK